MQAPLLDPGIPEVVLLIAGLIGTLRTTLRAPPFMPLDFMLLTKPTIGVAWQSGVLLDVRIILLVFVLSFTLLLSFSKLSSELL